MSRSGRSEEANSIMGSHVSYSMYQPMQVAIAKIWKCY